MIGSSGFGLEMLRVEGVYTRSFSGNSEVEVELKVSMVQW